MVECYRACEQDSGAFSLQRCLIYSYSYDFARLGLSISSPIFTGPHAPLFGTRRAGIEFEAAAAVVFYGLSQFLHPLGKGGARDRRALIF